VLIHIPSRRTPTWGKYAKQRSQAVNPEAWDGLTLNMHAPLGHTGDTIRDVSGRKNNGNNVGTTFSPGGRMGGAWEFNGSTSYISLPASPSISAGDNLGFAISAWVYNRDITSDGAVCGQWPGAAPRRFLLYLDEGGAAAGYRFIVSTAGGTLATSVDSGGAVQDKWQHIVAVYQSPSVYVYTDGVLTATASGTGGAMTTAVAAPAIGSDHGGAAARVFDGLISSVGIWNRSLSPSLIKQRAGDPHYIVRPKVEVAAPDLINRRRRMLLGASA